MHKIFGIMGKLTEKQEAFARFVAEGNTYSDAYRKSYSAEKMKFTSVNVNASKLMSDTKISLRVIELQEAASERTKVTIESVTAELEEARMLAISTDKAAAMVSASMGKAKVNGLLVDKVDADINGNVQVSISGPLAGI